MDEEGFDIYGDDLTGGADSKAAVRTQRSPIANPPPLIIATFNQWKFILMIV